MKYITLIIMAMFLSGCYATHYSQYWRADGTGFGFEDDDELSPRYPGPDEEYVCYGTYAGCEHAFNVPGLSTTQHEPPLSLIDPNSNLTPPMDSLPGQ